MKKTLILLEISLLFSESPVACGVFARGNQEFQQRQ
jgi:hypothetical protein